MSSKSSCLEASAGAVWQKRGVDEERRNEQASSRATNAGRAQSSTTRLGADYRNIIFQNLW
jgi:hypothetical protein